MELPNFKLLYDALFAKNLPKAKEAYKKLCTENLDSVDLIKTHLELHLRSQSFELSKKGVKEVQEFLDFVVSLAKEDLCLKASTVSVLQDIFDISSKQKCEEFFVVVENTIVIWKTKFFFDACKTSVLRMCNDLLKRLSQTVDTGFCGRILILLAKALPLNERSGLNLMSQINASNVTLYDEDVEMREETGENEEDVDMEVGEIREQKDLNIDYDLYVKFWKLQSFFVSPTQAYNQEKWLPFESDLTDVLSIFSTYKLERPRDEETSKSETKPSLNGISNRTINGVTKPHPVEEFNSFSAKYLTNQKLFHLQIADSQFRRYFLTQCLIFTNYLLNPSIKSRDPTLFMSNAQEKTVTGWSERCYQLLKETYPHGAGFANSLEEIIKNDKRWSDWKNEGCPDLVAEIQPSKLMTYKRKEIDPYDPNVVDLGNVELTRLWNIDTNNLNACKSEKRVFNQVLDNVLEEVLDEFDPDQQVEEQYMKCSDEKFQWTCSRHLLYNNYQHFTMASASSDSHNKGEPVTSAYQLRTALLNAASSTTYKERAIEIKDKLSAAAKKRAEQAALELANKEKLAAEKKQSESPIVETHVKKDAKELEPKSIREPVKRLADKDGDKKPEAKKVKKEDEVRTIKMEDEMPEKHEKSEKHDKSEKYEKPEKERKRPLIESVSSDKDHKKSSNENLTSEKDRKRASRDDVTPDKDRKKSSKDKSKKSDRKKSPKEDRNHKEVRSQSRHERISSKKYDDHSKK